MKKTLLALAGAVMLLVLVLGVKTCADRRMHGERFVFDTARVDQVIRLEASYGPQKAVLEKRDGRWVTGQEGFPADTTRLRRVLTALMRIRAAETVSESGDPARLAEFGLNEGEAKRIRWKMASGEEYTLLLGKTSGADYNSTFWKWEGAREVYRTPGDFTHEASVSEHDWKSRRVFPAFGPEDARSVVVEWIDSAGVTTRYRIDRTSDSTASLSEPVRAALPGASVGQVFGELAGFGVDAFVEPWEERAAMKLDTPLFKVEIVLKDASVHRLEAGAIVQEGALLYRYARLPGAGRPVKIFEKRFTAFRKSPGQLLNPPPSLSEMQGIPVETIDPATFEDDGRGF